MTRSVFELRAILNREYPFQCKDEDKAAIVDEWLPQFSDLGDFWPLYIAANEDQRQKVLETAITLCETTSDVDEIIFYYQEGSDLYRQLIDKKTTLPQDGDADI